PAGSPELIDGAAVGIAQGDQVLAAAVDVGDLTFEDLDRRLVVTVEDVFTALVQGDLHGEPAGVLGVTVAGGGEGAQGAEQQPCAKKGGRDMRGHMWSECWGSR